jgi:hypothetical protein
MYNNTTKENLEERKNSTGMEKTNINKYFQNMVRETVVIIDNVCTQDTVISKKHIH